MANKTLVIITISIAQLIVQFSTQLITIRLVGINYQSDIYFLSQAIPTFFSAVILSAVLATWTSKMSNGTNCLNKQTSVSHAQALCILLGALISLCYLPFTSWWMPTLFSIKPGSSLITATILTSIFSLNSILNNLIFIINIYSKNKKSINVELLSLAISLATVPAIYIFVPDHGVVSAATINLTKTIITISILNSVYKIPLPPITEFNKYCNPRKELIFNIIPPSIFKLMPVIDRLIISNSSTGSITIFTLSQTIISSISFVIEKGISYEFSNKLLNAGTIERKEILLKVVKISALISAIFAMILTILSSEVDMAFSRILNHDSIQSNSIATIIIILCGQLFASLAGPILVFNLNINHKNNIASSISLGGFFIGVLLKLLLFPNLGVVGICIATSVYLTLNIASFYIANTLNRKNSK